MDLTNYAGLKAAVAKYLARSDLTEEIPVFIQLAENRLRRELRLRQMLKVSTTTTTPNDSTVELPPDFLMMRDLHLNANPIAVLRYDAPNVFYRNTFSTISGKPVSYTLLAQEFQLAPIPDTNYTMQMLYYAAPPYMSSTVPSNVFLANCPDLLLYGSLAEAEPYLMNDARLETWAALYQRGKDALEISDDQGEYAGSPLAMTVASR
jgi:hypothetical protein